jgi:hypothetical protein
MDEDYFNRQVVHVPSGDVVWSSSGLSDKQRMERMLAEEEHASLDALEATARERRADLKRRRSQHKKPLTFNPFQSLV